MKVSGKLIRRSLETDVFTTAKLKLMDFVKAEHDEAPSGPVKIGNVGAALKAYLRSLRSANDIAAATKKYYIDCVRVLLKTLTGLRVLPLEKLTMKKRTARHTKQTTLSFAVRRGPKSWRLKLAPSTLTTYSAGFA